MVGRSLQLTWEDVEGDNDVFHHPPVSRDEALRLMRAVAQGDLAAVNSFEWQPGYYSAVVHGPVNRSIGSSTATPEAPKLGWSPAPVASPVEATLLRWFCSPCCGAAPEPGHCRASALPWQRIGSR